MRLRTSKKAEETLKTLQSLLHLQPNVLIRLAVAMSLNDGEAVDETENTDTSGLELNRATLTGDFDSVFKVLVTEHANRQLEDDEYFPRLFKAHMERGLDMLQDEYQYAGNYGKFIMQLASLGEAV
ncbi:DNA sulfur modification protein DndE [Paenibacillus soyae]|uniref:DNA sulfur modification protein DndE n=1 Tax=Paenibacillus soyae TaxID=2969249 RepID=A0A9X2MS80_9BACL|nr:DNA sulfur modification protein DndE [Paenibacillus soyae]MCR2805390.1 DNA sulfur modification protein DndE [Paenibacillus soyae]